MYLCVFTNIIFLACTFWVVSMCSFVTNHYVSNKTSHTLYECGFKTTTSYKINFSLNSVLAAIFVLLYEIEFVIVVPLFFNIQTFYNLPIVCCSMLLGVFITFILDAKLNAIKWVY